MGFFLPENFPKLGKRQEGVVLDVKCSAGLDFLFTKAILELCRGEINLQIFIE